MSDNEREIQKRLLDKISAATPQNIAEETSLARHRGVQKGYIYQQGPSWFVRFYRYDREGNKSQPSEYLGPAKGPERLSRREAERKAQDDFLDAVNRQNLRPSSSMLLADFIELKFIPQHVERRKPAGQKHYDYLLRCFVLPALGNRKLCDVQRDDVETLASQMTRKGLSYQTVLHVRNCVSAIFNHAKSLNLYQHDNPAAYVDLGERPTIRRKPTYSWEQAMTVLARLPSPVKEMARLSLTTSMNVAEMCGLRLKWCNFTDSPAVVEGEVLAPFSVAVRENYYRNKYGSLKTGKRCRNLPVTRELAERLEGMLPVEAPATQEVIAVGDSPLFASRNGTPVDAHNIAARFFRPLAKKLGFPVTWHALRRCHSSMVGQLDGIALEDRVATMGHADASMTLYYSIADVERRREIPKQIEERLNAIASAEPVPGALKEMKAKGGVQ